MSYRHYIRRNPKYTKAELRRMSPVALYNLIRGTADGDYADWMDEHRDQLVHAIYTVLDSMKPAPLEVESAARYIREAAEHMASMPPPGPGRLKDDIGLSGSTNGPIRFFTALDPADISFAQYLGAAEYLRAHAQTQLNYASWRRAHTILKSATPTTVVNAQKTLTIAGRKEAKRHEDPQGSVEAKGDGRLILDLNDRISGAHWRKLGLTGVRFDGDTYTWVVDARSIDDAISALTSLKLYVLADEVERLQEDGLIGEGAEKDVDTTSAGPQSYGDVRWRWIDGRVAVRGMRIKTTTLQSAGLTKGKTKDFQWVKDDSGFTLYFAPTAPEQLLDDDWIKDNYPVIQRIADWVDANHGEHKIEAREALEQAEAAAKAKSEICSVLGPIWKAASVDEIEDPKVRSEIRHINQAITWPAGLKPFAYQEVGIGYAIMNGGRAYIGDAMGLGKTLQAIGVLKYDVRKYTPAVVVCPSGVVYNWRDEIRRFAPELTPIPVTKGNQILPAFASGLVLIMSWDMMKRHAETLKRASTLILDEAHYGKNFKAKRTKVALELTKVVPHVLLLSGTPFPNRPIELFSQLAMLDPKRESSIFTDLRHKYGDGNPFTAFGQEYADGERKHVGRGRMVWDFSGASNLQGLREHLSCMMVARKKTQPGIKGQLPPKTRTQLWIPLEGGLKRAYQAAQRSFLARACENAKDRAWPEIEEFYAKNGEVTPTLNFANSLLPDYTQGIELVAIGALLRDVGMLKIPAAVDWIKGFLSSSPDPLVVFVKHKAVLGGIGEALNKMKIDGNQVPWTFVDGSVNPQESHKRALAFQDGQYRVIVATEKLKEGENLQNSADMLFVERWWVPGYEEQAEGRVHRQGSRGVPVTIRYLMIEDTVDEKIHDMVDEKRGNFEDVFGAEDVNERVKAGKVPDIRQALIDDLTRHAIDECQFKRKELKTRLGV